jgi:hypothetical protein
MLATVMQIIGAMLVVVGLAVWSVPLALVVAGVSLMVTGWLAES